MKTPPADISVLCIDDEPGRAEPVGTFLERADDDLTVTGVTNATDALETFDLDSFDCVVSEYDMPDVDGLALLDLVRADHPNLPFILFTGRGSEEIASEAISAGVTDYVQKRGGSDQYQVLAQRIRNAVSHRRLNEDATAAQEHAELILETSPNAVVVSVDGRCVYCNSAGEALLEPLEESDILDTPVTEFLHPEREPGALAGVRAIEAEFEQERFTLGTDRRVPVEGAARRIRWNGEPAVVYVFSDITDRVEYEAELAYRQRLLTATFEGSPDAAVVTGTDREVLAYNQQFLELWGLTDDLLRGGDFETVLTAVEDVVTDPEALRQGVDAQYDDPEAREHGQVRLTDGRLLEQDSTPVWSEDGSLLGVVWFYRDVTGVERLEREQREAFERMTDAVFAIDEAWEFTFLNDRAGELLERDPEEMVGRNVWEEFPEAVGSEVYDQYHDAVEAGESTTFEFYFPPLDTVFEVRAYPSDTGLTVYFRDVTSQRRTQSELEEAVETLHRLYEIASDPERPFAAKQRDLLEVGCDYLDLPTGFVTELTESTQTVVESAGGHEGLQAGDSCPLEESYCRKTIATESGLLAVHDAVAAGWEDDDAYERFGLGTYIGGKVVVDGELYGTVCFADEAPRDREFSEMQRTFVELLSRWLAYELEHREHNAQLERKNDQLEEFASIVSHDLRNPLSVADGYLELAREESDSEHLEKVADAHTRMDELIEDILTLSRDGEVVGERTRVDLGAVSRESWSHVDTDGATLTVESETPLLADRSRLVQLLENLFRNSVEHGGCDVTVRVGALDDGFYVEDTGSGIDADLRERLFEPGVSGAENGTGIGLRVVKQIITAHGWSVSVDESTEGGARFEITGVESA
jgi:PAS domain S-box-containing protein